MLKPQKLQNFNVAKNIWKVMVDYWWSGTFWAPWVQSRNLPVYCGQRKKCCLNLGSLAGSPSFGRAYGSVSPRRSIFLIGLYNTTKAKSMRYNYYMVLVPRKLGIAELTYQWNYACNSQSGVNRIGQTNMLLFIYLIIHEAQSYIVTSMIRSLICAKNSKDFLCLI